MSRYFGIVLTGAVALAMGSVATARSEQAGTQQTEAKPASAAASRGVMQDRLYKSPAEKLYVEKCAMCHREMGMGTFLLSRRMDPAQAQLEDRTNLTAQFVTLVARHGIGNMPAIPPGEVSDEQLQIIARYLARETAR